MAQPERKLHYLIDRGFPGFWGNALKIVPPLYREVYSEQSVLSVHVYEGSM
ncbi:MAG: hypothetical protein QF632_05140 [Candidatus Woesearchaeota archaeon]|jgi:hypothetical protein|nr:hypothetical protein [Candidatus Woesearchaeota archaeon]MDP7324116.1 hypothetical protein [Candidatus Woesearchaeota archaeon]MDP7457166.1 hypothetical protein [Candidatus Woesearchaeota archaeon]|tara:strand:- start:43 stop:195 length:153 start_codon:yes stop_codon:yes gene_type:complete